MLKAQGSTSTYKFYYPKLSQSSMSMASQKISKLKLFARNRCHPSRETQYLYKVLDRYKKNWLYPLHQMQQDQYHLFFITAT